jgi:hypothetical protein
LAKRTLRCTEMQTMVNMETTSYLTMQIRQDQKHLLGDMLSWSIRRCYRIWPAQINWYGDVARQTR